MKKTNSEPYLVTYLHSKGRRMGLPIAGNFELTARCNFNCPMCYVHLSDQQVREAGGELTAQQWLDLAAAAQKKGMVFALLTGGEPLVRKDFFEIYQGMKKLGLIISINTNGSMLRGEIFEKFLKDPPFRFNISLYGGSNDTYRNMCGLPVYDQVKENIRALREAGVDVSLNLSITPYNKQDIERIYADAVELDVNVKASAYMYPSIRVNDGKFGCGNRLSPEDAAECTVAWDLLRFSPEEFAIRAERMSRMMGDGTEKCPMETDEGVLCRAGSSSFWVTWDGKMTPCGMMTTPVVYPLETGFEEAWEALRSKTAQIRMPSACSGCSYRELCGACPAISFTETGAFDRVPEYLCQKTKAEVKITQQVFAERKHHED